MIDILMAVYNGESYISAQIDSIIVQTNSNWRLIILDDCSEDGTMDILKTYEQTYPDKIIIHRNDANTGSACKNFFKLLKYSEHNYAMFCDHDDVWDTHKIEDTYRQMLELEQSNQEFTAPLLVHTDLTVVNQKLNTISNSLFKMQKLNPDNISLNNLLVQNIVTGCTVMVNKALIDIIKETPKHAIMHDWWFALIACCFGKIGFLNKSTILYRQHNKNQVGAKKATSLSYIINKFFDRQGIKKTLNLTYLQANEFLNKYNDYFTPKQIEIFKAYISLPKQSKFKKLKIIKKYKLYKYGFFRKLGHLFFV